MTARTTMAIRPALIPLLMCLLWSGTSAAAEDPLTDAKRAYEAAAYEDALRLLEPLETPEARQYAALCLLALGRADAAARTVEAMIADAPLFSPSTSDVPPRFATLVTETRRKMLPVAARKAFADGRERFNAKKVAEAMPLFELALKLADDPLWRGSADADDLRTLAGGFAQLARAAAPAPANSAAASAASTATTAPLVSPGSPAAAAPSAPAAAAPASPRPSTVAPRVTVPRPIKEVVPQLPASLTRTAAPVATVKLLIGADGRVASATVSQSAHPRYDEILMNASREWLYEPGTLDGKPVPSERILTLRLR